jgi:hypothetical protein
MGFLTPPQTIYPPLESSNRFFEKIALLLLIPFGEQNSGVFSR